MTVEATNMSMVEVAVFQDSCAEAALWLCQDLGIALPPLFEHEFEHIQEISTDRLFATDRSLVTLVARDALETSLAGSAWPSSGMAFGLLDQGLMGRWFHIRVSARALILISLRVRAYPEEDHIASLGLIDACHATLARRLAPGGDLAEVLTVTTHDETDARRVLIIDDMDGRLRLLEAAHTPFGLSAWESPTTALERLPSSDAMIVKA